jgi:hypothetical protein
MSQEYSVVIKPRKIRRCIEPDCKSIAIVKPINVKDTVAKGL